MPPPAAWSFVIAERPFLTYGSRWHTRGHHDDAACARGVPMVRMSSGSAKSTTTSTRTDFSWPKRSALHIPRCASYSAVRVLVSQPPIDAVIEAPRHATARTSSLAPPSSCQLHTRVPSPSPLRHSPSAWKSRRPARATSASGRVRHAQVTGDRSDALTC
jgi:hypothetical protein